MEIESRGHRLADLPCKERFVVKVSGEVVLCPFEVVALLYDMPGDREAASTEWDKNTLRIPLAAPRRTTATRAAFHTTA